MNMNAELMNICMNAELIMMNMTMTFDNEHERRANEHHDNDI